MRIQYRCKKCAHEWSVPAEWEDLKPQKCVGHKCKTFFVLEPEMLIIKKPKPLEQVKVKEAKVDGKDSNSKVPGRRKYKS